MVFGLFSFATVFGMRVLGIRIRRLVRLQLFPNGRTLPQSMLLSTLLLSLTLVVVMLQFSFVVPQYVTFGSQRNGRGDRCSLADLAVSNRSSSAAVSVDGAADRCLMTEFGKMALTVSLHNVFFADVLYFGSWLLVFAVPAFAIAVWWQGPRHCVNRAASFRRHGRGDTDDVFGASSDDGNDEDQHDEDEHGSHDRLRNAKAGPENDSDNDSDSGSDSGSDRGQDAVAVDAAPLSAVGL